VVFLVSYRQNDAGDALFECSLICGYMAIWRVRTGHFEPPPWRSSEGWQPPLIFDGAGLRAAKGPAAPIVEPTPACSRDQQDPTQLAGGELAPNARPPTSMETAGHQETPVEPEPGQASESPVERMAQHTHGVAPGDASTDPGAAAPQHLPEPRTTGEGSKGSVRREDKHRRAHVRATQERRNSVKRIRTAEEDNAKPQEATNPSGSHANGDGVGRDGNGAGRRKTVTPAQREANRRNALKSTGPKTPEGKANVRLNPLQHGILSQEVLLPDEDEHALADLEHRLWDDWQPVGAHEEFLVDLILRQMWRLRRAGRLEAAILAAEEYKIALDRAQAEAKSYERMEQPPSRDPLTLLQEELVPPPPPPKLVITHERKHQEALASAAEAKALVRGELATFGWAFMQVVAGADPFTKLSRYETAILRSLERAFEDLRRLQQARRGNADPTAQTRARRRALRTRAKNRHPRRRRNGVRISTRRQQRRGREARILRNKAIRPPRRPR